MKVFYLSLIFCIVFLSSCESPKIPFSDLDVTLISDVFAQNQKMHEDLLSTPPKLSVDQIKISIAALEKSAHPKVKEWRTRLTETLPKNPKDLDSSYEDLSKFSLVLVEIKKEIKLPEAYQQFYCPMVEKYWVAKEKEVRNPYAPEMRDCGDLIPEAH